MIFFLQLAPVEPQPGFMQQYSFIIMIGLMAAGIWFFIWLIKSLLSKNKH